MWTRITARTIEVFQRGKRVAAQVRSSSNRKHTTSDEHMPSISCRYAECTPGCIVRRTAEIGPSRSALIEIIMREKRDPGRGFRKAEMRWNG